MLHISLNVPASGAGTELLGVLFGWVQFRGVTDSGATVVLEGSNDLPGVVSPSWTEIDIPRTVDGWVEIPMSVVRVRVNRVVAGTGTITALLMFEHISVVSLPSNTHISL